jgi:hypothetical protein
MLSQLGFSCKNLAGGYRLYASVKREAPSLAAPTTACGAPKDAVK